MIRFTKGPWVAKRIEAGGLHYWIIAERQYNGFQICSTANDEVPDAEANARLISAAPELYRELRLALLQVPCICHVRTANLDGYWDARCQTCGPAKDVIAKAEGEK